MERRTRWITGGVVAAVMAAGIVGVRSYNEASPPESFQSCSDGKPAHPSYARAADLQIRKLSEYEQLCKGEFTDTLMLFAAMPRDESEATTLASATAKKLKLLEFNGLKPLVVFEPDISSPTILRDIYDGRYDQAFATYYQALRTEKITDKTMGEWVLLPEANTPIWQTTDPEVFRGNVTKLASLQKQFFPHSRVSILLNSRSYENSDWTSGKVESLLPYVSGIPHGLVNSFGYQGFPNTSVDVPVTPSTVDAREFLPASIAIEAARKLGSNALWLNTGSFATAAREGTDARKMLDTDQRRAALMSVLGQAALLQKQSFSVTINLFAADKSQQPERVDWSYWRDGHAEQGRDTSVLKEFAIRAREQSIKLSLFDTSTSR